jgi:hypothetical protein
MGVQLPPARVLGEFGPAAARASSRARAAAGLGATPGADRRAVSCNPLLGGDLIPEPCDEPKGINKMNEDESGEARREDRRLRECHAAPAAAAKRHHDHGPAEQGSRGESEAEQG